MEHYYLNWIGDETKGKWNVIQVIGDIARYYILKGTLDAVENDKPLMVTHGWMEEGEFTDGEDYTSIKEWERKDGILISF